MHDFLPFEEEILNNIGFKNHNFFSKFTISNKYIYSQKKKIQEFIKINVG